MMILDYIISWPWFFLLLSLVFAMLVISAIIKKPKVMWSFIISVALSGMFCAIHFIPLTTLGSHDTFIGLAKLAVVILSVYLWLFAFIAMLSIHFAIISLKSKLNKILKIVIFTFFLCLFIVSAGITLNTVICSFSAYLIDDTYSHAEKLEPPIVLSAPIEFQMEQGSTVALPDSNDGILIKIGDITRGQVITSLSWFDGAIIVTARSMRENDRLTFEAEGHRYVITLKELRNVLAGEDTARFELSPVKIKTEQWSSEDDKIEKLSSSTLQKGERLRYGSTKSPDSSLIKVTKISTGSSSSHNLGLKCDGSIVGWGWNDYDNAVPPDGNNYIDIATGGSHSLALKTDGTIIGWGWNHFGQATLPDGNDYIAIAACSNYSLALKSDGSITGWGSNRFDQITVPDGNDYVDIAAGWFHSLALKNDGSIVSWGGQATPPKGNDFIAIAAGHEYSLALKTDGSIVEWGSSFFKESAMPNSNNFVAIAAGKYHCLALKNDGSIVGWGLNNKGQATPPKGNYFTAIAAGGNHSLALKADGSVIGWGANWSGQATPAQQ